MDMTFVLSFYMSTLKTIMNNQFERCWSPL